MGQAENGGRVVLCGANAYEQKYYFNPLFERLPENIRQELRVICVLFTQDAGGVFTIEFDEDGDVQLVTDAEEEDITYDEVGAGLMVGEVRRKRRELFETLRLYYRIFVRHEDPAALLAEEDA